jgi:hypothetical protein
MSLDAGALEVAGAGFGREHLIEDALEGHCVGTSAITSEEVARAAPLVARKLYVVIAVFTVKADTERLEANSVSLLSVTPRLFDLAD